MESNLARSLVRDTFTQRFDKGRFLHFIRNLLNHINESKATPWNKTYVKDAFKPGIKKFERIGTYTDPGGEQIDILIVHLERESSLERARTFLRNFVADYLVTRGQKDAALAAFVSPSEADWRFSLVKMEYTTEQSESGTVKISESLTPARRYSFLVGENEDSYTAQAQLLDILADTDQNPSLEALELAFGIERVTKEFFEQYKTLFLDLKDELDRLVASNPRVRRDFESKSIETIDFAKKLLGQVVFLYFLQKKGWFGVERDAEWGTGPKNYLRQLFKSRERIGAFSKSGSDGVNFFNDILEPLFYEALAKGDREDDYYGHFHCKIPFLNGGLFDPLNGYDWIHTDINLPDILFSNNERTNRGDIGTGILDVFDRYNFTVNEAEPLEKEVAVDPEMLGKVFENLLEVKERKSKGSYYTPREIVYYMCREGLVSYLEKELMEARVSRPDIETLLRVGEQAADFELARLDQSTGYKAQLPKSIELNAPLIDSKLQDVTVCDPAVGSGVFLVGMMSEIVRARKTLTPYFSDRSRRTVYEFKRHAIQTSLYGVDIDPGAVEIAKLRLWLSLVVDEDDIKEIKPLPNLDYKIMQGDSLIEEFEGVKLFDKRLVEQPSLHLKARKAALNSRIAELSHQFFDLHGRGHRDKQTRRAIETEIAKLKKEMKALDAPGAASALPAQREIDDLFSEAQRKLPQLEQLHHDLFEASAGGLKKQIREKLTGLEWEIMEATVKDGIRQILERLSHLVHDLNSARRRNERATVIEKLERKVEDLKDQKKEREEAAKHLRSLRNSNVKPFFLWRLHFLEVFQQKEGFDVVVGNPPYVRADSGEAHLATRRAIEQSGRFETLWEKWDLYVAFIERGFKLLRPGGVITLIVSDAYCHSKYAQKSQRWFLKNSRILRLDFLSRIKVFEATVRNIVFFFQRSEGANNRPKRRVHGPEFGTVESLPSGPQMELSHRAFFPEEGSVSQLTVPTIELEQICYISKGMVVHANERTVRGSFELSDLVSEKPDAIHPKAFVEGKLVDRWLPKKNKWLEWGTNRAPSEFSRPTFREMYDVPQKLISVDMAAGVSKLRVSYDDQQLVHNHSAWSFVPWYYLSGVRNKSIKKSARYQDECPASSDFPSREMLEAISRRFDVKYLLAVMNSSFARDFLRANRRSNIHLYPEDWKKLPVASATKTQQKPIVNLVEKMLAAKKEIAAAEESIDKRRLDQFCADLDREIDQKVYELYELTAEEIELVDGSDQV